MTTNAYFKKIIKDEQTKIKPESKEVVQTPIKKGQGVKQIRIMSIQVWNQYPKHLYYQLILEPFLGVQ